jgi:hypothetical protein
MADLPKGFKKEKLPTGFVEEAEALDEEGLDNLIVKCEEMIYEVDKEIAKDEKLNAAKALVKEYSSAYRETQKVLQMKIKYSIYMKESRGYI